MQPPPITPSHTDSAALLNSATRALEPCLLQLAAGSSSACRCVRIRPRAMQSPIYFIQRQHVSFSAPVKMSSSPSALAGYAPPSPTANWQLPASSPRTPPPPPRPLILDQICSGAGCGRGRQRQRMCCKVCGRCRADADGVDGVHFWR